MLSEAETDALVRWEPGASQGHVESFFIKLNLPRARALWLKLTLLRRLGRGETVAEGWAIAFDLHDSGHVALKNTWPVSQADIARDRFYIRVRDVQWSFGATHGALVDPDSGDAIRWDLSYTLAERGFRHMPARWMYERNVPKSKATSPQIDSRFSGWVEVNGARTEIADAPGMLGHNWGLQQAEFWAWAHANMWDVDGVVFEGVTSRVKFGPLTSPLLTVVHVRVPGEPPLTMNGLTHLVGTRSTCEGLSWRVSARTRDRRVEARFHAPAERFVGVTYHDPDGRTANCLNTKIADAELSVTGLDRGRWRHCVNTTCAGAAALEIGDREGTRGVRMYIR